MEDAPLSDQDGANEDLEVVDVEVIEAERPGGDGGSAPRHSPHPEEVPEQIPNQLEDNLDEVAGEGDPQACPKILRMTFLSLTRRCFKASGQ